MKASGRATNVKCAAFVLAVLTALITQASPATSDDSPITINSCGAILGKSSGPTVQGISLASTSSGIRIEFANESAKTADLVNFAVDSNGDRFVIRDVGTFSPGVSIKHEFRNGAGQAFVLPMFIAPKITCHVASVKFTDGTVWRKGQPQAASTPTTVPAMNHPAAISANPSRLTLDRAAESELFMVSSSERVTAFKETDDCTGVASVFVAATGDSTATYSVKPVAPGTCTAHVSDEAGNTLAIPIVVK